MHGVSAPKEASFRFSNDQPGLFVQGPDENWLLAGRNSGFDIMLIMAILTDRLPLVGERCPAIAIKGRKMPRQEKYTASDMLVGVGAIKLQTKKQRTKSAALVGSLNSRRSGLPNFVAYSKNDLVQTKSIFSY